MSGNIQNSELFKFFNENSIKVVDFETKKETLKDIYLSAWVITYVIYLPWVFIGNLGLKSYGEWAQKKFEQDMDELESGE